MKFGAPWSTSVKWITGLTVSFLVILVIFGITRLEDVGSGSGSGLLFFLAAVVMPALLLVVSACWMIRGYVVTDDMLLVQRLGWQSKMDLKELVSVEADPEAMARSLRTLGVGGLSAFVGDSGIRNWALIAPMRQTRSGPSS